MRTNYKHLNCEKHMLKQLSLEQECSLLVIGHSLQRAQSSIRHELKRNGWTNPTTGPRKRGRPPLAGRYRLPDAPQRTAGHTVPIASGRSWSTVALSRPTIVQSACALPVRAHTSPM